MKKNLIITVMIAGMVAAAMPLAAEGSQEDFTRGAAQGRYAEFQGEEIDLTGTIEVGENGQVKLSVDGSEYTLLYPRMLADDVALEDGKQIEVSGFQVPGPSEESDAAGEFVRVEKVVIDGEEFVLDRGRGSQGRMSGNGRMSDRGRATGGNRGSDGQAMTGKNGRSPRSGNGRMNDNQERPDFDNSRRGEGYRWN